jgi:hypothetical protein
VLLECRFAECRGVISADFKFEMILIGQTPNIWRYDIQPNETLWRVSLRQISWLYDFVPGFNVIKLFTAVIYEIFK